MHESPFGPIFGVGHDFCIYIDSTNNRYSCSYLANTYEIPPGQTDKF